ncbi:CocE/NonD family hydrolase [Nocardia brasiliensis]
MNVEFDVPIVMDDGVTLKADVYHPADNAGNTVSEPLPVVVTMTPYSKLFAAMIAFVQDGTPMGEIANGIVKQFDPSPTLLDGVVEILNVLPAGFLQSAEGVSRPLVQRGFVQVVIDTRGLGNSEGRMELMSDRERQDVAQSIEWASGQPWSNGRIGMTGTSYLGATTMEGAISNPPGLEAVVPLEPMLNFGRDGAGPGGAFNLATPVYAYILTVMHFYPPFSEFLAGRFNPQWLVSRLQDPFPYSPEILQWGLLGQGPMASPGDEFWRQRAISTEQISRITAKTLLIDGWNDVLIGDNARIYQQLNLPPGEKQLIIGDWNHITMGRGLGSGPGVPPTLTELVIGWFERWLKDIDNGIDKKGPVSLAQLGGTWTTTADFPRPGVEYRRLYLNGASSGTSPASIHDGSLAKDMADNPASVTVPPGAAMLCSQDATRQSVGIFKVLGAVCNDSDAIKETNALSFTSPPADEPIQYSGPANIHLEVSTPATEAVWFISVNDVAPDGTSVVRSTGNIVSSHRKIDDAQSIRLPDGEYAAAVPSLRTSDIQPVLPNVPHALDIQAVPTDLILQPGHRLRINILGVNLGPIIPNLPQAIGTALAPQTVHLDPLRPSYVTLPVVGKAAFG